MKESKNQQEQEAPSPLGWGLRGRRGVSRVRIGATQHPWWACLVGAGAMLEMQQLLRQPVKQRERGWPPGFSLPPSPQPLSNAVLQPGSLENTIDRGSFPCDQYRGRRSGWTRHSAGNKAGLTPCCQTWNSLNCWNSGPAS